MPKEKQNKTKKSKVIHLCIIASIVVLLLAIAGIIILKYQVEGETNPPFELTKLIVVSTAQGYEKENPSAKWDLEIDQNNDFYIGIEKNPKYSKSEVIKSVTLEKFSYQEMHQKGTMCLYRPAETGLYKREEQNKFENSIIYTGKKETNLKQLEIANQGGVILFRATNQNVSEYVSEEGEEILHDGTILAKTNILPEQIETNLSFDILIETGSNVKYKATIKVKLPIEGMLQEGTATYEKTDFEDVILKRVAK